MFGWLKKRERAEHLKLMRQTIERAEQLLSFSELVISSGAGSESAVADAVVYSSFIEEMKPLLHEIEHTDGARLPPDIVNQLLYLWKDWGARLEAIEWGRKEMRKRMGRP